MESTKRLQSLLLGLEHITSEPFHAGTFDHRLRIQKAVILLRALGHPIATQYRFSN